MIPWSKPMHNKSIKSGEKKMVLTESDAREFALAACYETRGERPLSCCVDGRVDEAGEHTPAAKPGADAGDMMVALAALRMLAKEKGIDIPAIRGDVLAEVVAVAGGAERFRFHTDTHAEHDLAGAPEEARIGRGCGHLKQAEKYPGAYALEAEDMEDIFRTLVRLKREGAKEVVLEGSHGERAVLVVESAESGLGHSATDAQAFVYHAGCDAACRRDLARRIAGLAALREKGIFYPDVLRAMEDAAAQQRGETLSRLAAGLPIYAITEGGGAVVSLGAVAVRERAA